MSDYKIDRDGEDALGIHDNPRETMCPSVSMAELRKAFAKVRRAERHPRNCAREHLSANAAGLICLHFADGSYEWRKASFPPVEAIQVDRPAPVPVDAGPPAEYAMATCTFIRQEWADDDGRRYWIYLETTR